MARLVRQLEQGDRGALSHLLTLAATQREVPALHAAVAQLPVDGPPVVALTGSGGVGKSSLMGALAAHLSKRGERVGVLACDPESPVTGGALLGDRCRIVGASAAAPSTDRVFVRSLATASGQQGVASNMAAMLRLMKAFGFEWIFVETVGVGQGDVAVRSLADVVVLVLQPQTGDELQWEKAGILEIADIVVVNKSDLPGSDQTAADVTEQLHVGDKPGAVVVKTSVARNEGIADLCRAIETARTSRRELREART